MGDEMGVGEWGLVFVVLLIVAVAAVLLAGLPGLIAAKRRHPNAEAIQVCGIIGIFIWPCWIVALVWAYTGPDLGKIKPVPAPPPTAAQRIMAKAHRRSHSG